MRATLIRSLCLGLVCAAIFNLGPALGQSDGGLLVIDGRFSRVRYTPGFLDRANHVLARCDAVAEELKRMGKQPMTLSALVVTREQWDRAALSRPFGVPLAVSFNTVAAPGVGDAKTVALWERWMGSDLPRLPGNPLNGTHSEASSLSLSDMVMQREIAGMYADQLLLTRDSVWVRSVVSHLISLALFERFEAIRMAEIVAAWTRLGGQLPILVDLAGGAANAPVEAMMADEAVYFKAAYSIYSDMGRKAVNKVFKAGGKPGGIDAEGMLELFPSLLGMLPPTVSPLEGSSAESDTL